MATTSLPSVGQQQIPGKTLMFCNGIMNNPDSALESARIISNAFSNRQVFVYHNPTTLEDYFESKPEHIERQIDLAVYLSQEIKGFILSDRQRGIDNREICVILFVHSHGAVVAERALSVLEAEKQNIKIYSFGGATIIPNRLASRVQNFVFDEDLISDLGNVKATDKMVLYKAKQITKTMKEEGKALQIAIVEQAYKDLHMELHPISRAGRQESYETRLSKNQRYRQIFEQHDQQALISDPYFTERIRDYVACFTDYNIIILEGAPFQHPEYNQIKRHSNVNEFLENLPGNLASMIENAFKGLGAFGAHALTNHQFTAYSGVIQNIDLQETGI